MRCHNALLIAAPVLVACLAFGQGFSPSQTPFSASPQELQAAFSKIESGTHPVTILLEQGEFQFDSSGRRTLRYRMLFKVLTKAGGDNWAMIERRWAPWEEERPAISARVIAKDGTVRYLDQKTIADSPVRDNDEDILTDRRTVRAPLPAMDVDSIVEEEIVTKQTVVPLGAGVVEYFYFGHSVPVQRTIVRMQVPAAIPLRFKTRLLPEVSSSDKTADGMRELSFDQGPMKPLEDTLPLLPSDERRSPRLVFSTAADWNTVAKIYSDVVDKQLHNFDALAHLPKWPGTATRDEKILAVINMLNRDIRYTGIEFSESSLVPHDPVEVLARKYGDCKDKATLAVALLRSVGIDAHVALLYSSTGEDIEPDLPGIDAFNHAIVYVSGEPGLWLDPTDPHLTLGTISSSNQGRFALIARPQTTSLMRTPELTAEQNRVIERREFHLAELGRARVIESSEAFGTPDRNYRGIFGDKDEKALRNTLKQYVEWTYAEAKIEKITPGDPADLTKPYQLKIELADAQRGTTARTEAAVAIRVSQLASRLPDFFQSDPNAKDTKDDTKPAPPPRTADFAISEPYTYEWHYVIEAPPGFRIRQLPEAIDEKLGPASLTARFATEAPGKVFADFRFVMPKRRFSAAVGLALQSAVLELGKRKALLIYFDEFGETALASGNVKEAIREFAALRQLHPKEALHAMQSARAMLAAGAGETARAEAMRAVALEPKSAKVYIQLAEVLKNDLVGRSMEKGFDRTGAAAAYRKALELDPNDNETRANLAILLEYDQAGVRYTKGSNLDDSIAEYAKILDKLQGLGVSGNYAADLLYAGRLKELEAHLEKQPESEQNQVLWVCAESMLNGSTAGLKKAGEVSGLEAKRRVLSSAAQTLIALRRYALAADVLASAVAGAANPAVVTNLIEMLRKTRRVEELSQTIRQAEDAVRTLLTRAWLYEEHEADWIEPFSTFMVDGEDPDQFKTLAHIMASQKGKLRASGVTAEAALDLALSGTQFVREGSDENGWVVRMMTPGNGAATPQQQVFFVMRQDETYRILAANGDFAGVARLALRLVEQGSVQQAAIWLDRVRGELSAGNSDDSLSGHMFSRVWQKGVASDANRVRIAAALLLSDKPKEVAGVITMLEGALKSGADGTANAISASLAEAYSMDKQYAAALRINERLMEELPHSATALRLAFQSAYAAGGKSEADRILTAHIGAFKEDPDALRGVASVAMVFGDPDKATAIEQQIVDSGRAFAGDYNQIAWAALMADKVTAATIDIANRGVLMGGNGTTSLLHTLAAVEAELDKAGDARAMLLQRMKDLGEDEPDDDDWYVFGRIAESYGLRGDAVTMYRRLQRPKNERAIPSSSYALAQRRLKLMAASK